METKHNFRPSENEPTQLIRRAVKAATCKEDLSRELHMDWKEIVERADREGLLNDRETVIKMLSLQSSKIF